MAGTGATSIPDLLQLLDGPFAALAQGVAEDRYVLWLGSGISFGSVPGLTHVVPRVVEFLRSKVDATNSTCAFRTALNRAIALISPSNEERNRIDLTIPFLEWTDAASFIARWVGRYSHLLQITVPGERADYLLWTGIGLIETYANPELVPDAEHLCLAILVLEGVTSDLASANWDGLIERAVEELSGDADALIVCVRESELRQASNRARLFKLHGCAVKAAQDETAYRDYITGTQPQIDSWPERHPAMSEHLVGLITQKPTLMMGLSAQDSDIKSLFVRAQARMGWQWPGERPSFVFSEHELGFDQEGLLENVYRDAYNPDTRDDIIRSAALPAYAKPVLVALVLHVLTTKLQNLIDLAEARSLREHDRERLREGVRAIRDVLAAAVGEDKLAFVRTFVAQSGRTLTMFRTGRIPEQLAYCPISSVPVQRLNDPTLAEGLKEAAVAAGIIGVLVQDGEITLESADLHDAATGACVVKASTGSAKVIVAANSTVANRLQVNGIISDSDDAILIHSLEIIPRQSRSPLGSHGRKGRAGLREASMRELLVQSTSAEDLVQRFREGVGI